MVLINLKTKHDLHAKATRTQTQNTQKNPRYNVPQWNLHKTQKTYNNKCVYSKISNHQIQF
jgi:hypothetical protein